jgi:hypothetical protein
MVENLSRLIRYASYASLGLLLGFFGVTLHLGSLKQTLSLISTPQAEMQLASACLLERTQKEEDIFFLSCGGIF